MKNGRNSLKYALNEVNKFKILHFAAVNGQEVKLVNIGI